MQDRPLWFRLNRMLRIAILLFIAINISMLTYIILSDEHPPHYPCEVVSFQQLTIEADENLPPHVTGLFRFYRDQKWETLSGTLSGWGDTRGDVGTLLDDLQTGEKELRCVVDEEGSLWAFCHQPNRKAFDATCLLVFLGVFFGLPMLLVTTRPSQLPKLLLRMGIASLAVTSILSLATVHQNLQSTQGWQQVPCEVEVLRDIPDDWRWDAHYRFDFQGESLSGYRVTGVSSDRVMMTGPRLSSLNTRRFGVCYVNPENPRQSCLQRFDPATLLLGINCFLWLLAVGFSRRSNWERRLTINLVPATCSFATALWMLPGLVSDATQGELAFFQSMGFALTVLPPIILFKVWKRDLAAWRAAIKLNSLLPTSSAYLIEFFSRVADNRETTVPVRGEVSIAVALEAIRTGKRRSTIPPGKITIGEALEAIRSGKKLQ